MTQKKVKLHIYKANWQINANNQINLALVVPMKQIMHDDSDFVLFFYRRTFGFFFSPILQFLSHLDIGNICSEFYDPKLCMMIQIKQLVFHNVLVYDML